MRLLSVIDGDLNRLLVFELEDGNRVESVFYRGDTLCVSTQAGCPVGCVFCASGREGLIRNLTPEEITGQVLLARTLFPVKRVAFAGIGDPLLNWDSVRETFWWFKGEGLKVSFYTAGKPADRLKDLLLIPHSGVTVSVHSTDPEVRRKLMPHAGDLDSLLGVLREVLPSLSKRKRNKISLAYMPIKGVNDSEEEVVRIGLLAKELGVGITLLYYNKVSAFDPVGPERYEEIFRKLRSMGVRVTLSTRFRRDRIGGCGTLVINREV
ncbi:MAG: radical SAM protein [Aquificota bacterium]|nr:radical SAM protein [Aquificota bacterium]